MNIPTEVLSLTYIECENQINQQVNSALFIQVVQPVVKVMLVSKIISKFNLFTYRVIVHSLFDKMSSFCYLILCKFMVHTQQNGHQAIEMGDLASMCLAFDTIYALQRNLMHLLSTLCPGYISYSL